jgi:hypothetical protein
MLNLPPDPGTTGLVLLAVGALLGLLLVALLRGRVELELPGDRVVSWLVLLTLGATVAGTPYTLWRVSEDIRETWTIGPEHARYVGAETKLIDGELAQRVGAELPRDAAYYVAVAPDAFSEIRASLAPWLGYALVPRRQVRRPEEADWIVTWGAKPSELGLAAGPPRLVGRNRLVSREPVYVAPAS